jgi:CBS domain containing-hemolysin-like protein
VEIAILNGVLELNSKNVEEIMTPLKVLRHYFYVIRKAKRSLTGHGGVKR